MMWQDLFRNDSIAVGLLLAPIVFVFGIGVLYLASQLLLTFY